MAAGNRLKILRPEDIDASKKERIIIYGRAGIGKTRLALSIPDHWGKIGYFAADKNAQFLDSISKSKRNRIYPVTGVGNDPTAIFMQFCKQDWDEVDPEIGTLVVDTYTKVAQDAMSYSANTNAMSREPHFIVGTPGEGGIAIPNRGDYQAIDGLSRGFLDMIFDKQEDKHIIFLCHEDVKIIEDVAAVGGPAHPGRQMTEYLPAQFSTVIRLIRDTILNDGADEATSVVIAITENDGKFIAKFRTNEEDAPNPMARVQLERDPSSYWDQYEAAINSVAPPKKKSTSKKEK